MKNLITTLFFLLLIPMNSFGDTTNIKLIDDDTQKLFNEAFKDLPSISPLGEIGGEITLGFGPQIDPFTDKYFLHRGIDITNKIGTPIYATANGRIKNIKLNHTDFGNSIIIEHKYGYTTQYWHLDEVFVKEGDNVKQGEKIGSLGKTGRVTGPNLQYNILIGTTYVNPEDYLTENIFKRQKFFDD